MTSPTPYLVAWHLEGKRVLVVGGGSVGEGKVETLLPTGAHIVVIDSTPTDRLRDLAAAGRITWIPRSFRPWDVRDADFVIAVAGGPATNRRIARWAHRAGALVNALDDPADSDVSIPSVIKRGPATIAISTSGVSPAAARFLREEVSKAIPAGVGELVEQASTARKKLRSSDRYRYDYPAWRQRLLEPGLEAVRAGRTATIGELTKRFVAEFDGTTPISTGRVTLVGAGPGGADLITVRGANALASADVVLYDRLADPELLDLAPVAATRIPVGKGKGFGVTQDQIGALLVEHASKGHHVVRLKGGDPFVFGRGSEEAEVATAAGIPVEIVPGLSSALAGPALAGVPVTDRRVTAGFTVISGHRANDDDYDWAALARTEVTLVVLMAASTADKVAKQMLAAGRADVPVAFVHKAGSADQQVALRRLSEVAELGCPFGSPTVMVIGDVASQANVTNQTVAAELEAVLGLAR